MFDLFTKKEKPTPPEETPKRGERAASQGKFTAPGTQLRHDPQLVPELIAEHQRLLSLFADIEAASRERDMTQFQRLLPRFGDALREHLLKERIRFYVYVQHCVKDSKADTSLVKELQSEMQAIGKVVTEFLRKYSAGDEGWVWDDRWKWDSAQWQDAQREVNAIGEVLGRRIRTEEESLYPLYRSPDDY